MRIACVVLVVLAACGGDPAPPVGVAEQAVYDCGDPGQQFTCPSPAKPNKRFVCHATGSSCNAYVKLEVSIHSSHQPGVPHHPGRPADQAPGASADDVGTGAGLDCDCQPRICAGTCTGAPSGATCDDGDRCTGEGTCDGDACLPGASTCTAGSPVDACNIQDGTCDGGTGACGTAPLPAGTPCGTELACDVGGACVPIAHVAINEVESSGGVPGDWIELANSGIHAADVSGWRVLDNDDAHTAFVLPPGTVIPAGGFLVVEESSLGFGLGAADSARLFDATGAAADAFSWTAHAVTTYGRCPDGTGAFRTATSSTKGGANDCSVTVKLNEIESSGGVPGDWVELVNAGPVAVDVGGWTFKDSDDSHAFAIPAGTTIAAGAYLVLEEAAFGFGLGAADSARLFDATGAAVDAFAWTAHAATTYGRCPSGTGAFATTANITKGAANDCAGDPQPADPWPGQDAVVTVDGTGVFGGNGSGLFFEPDVLWAVRNGPSTLFRFTFDGTIWTPAASWTLRYPGGTGTPDAEDVTKAESSSAVYVATERDNDAGSISRPSILRFDAMQPGSELVATHEWNLAADLPAVGANLGLEAITWIPDTILVASSFFDAAAGHTYDPSQYPNHGTGLFFVGLEANGVIYAYALDHVGGGFTRIATIATGDASVKALAFDRETGYLWSHCGVPCANTTSVFAMDATAGSPTLGRLVLRRRFARPTTLPNIANEGIAIAPESQCAGGFKPYYWADDSETAGHTLRRDSIRCGPFIGTP